MTNLIEIKDILNENITPLGYVEDDQMVGIDPKNLIGNMMVFGRSGTGKSVLVFNVVLADLHHNRGGLLIDPHGDLVDTFKKYSSNIGFPRVIIYRMTHFVYT